MLVSDLVKISLRQIYRNKRRYRGAILGTSLGIAGLITVLTIGDSVESALGANLEVLGNATIVKATWHWRKTPQWHVGQYYQRDIDDVKKLPGVLSVASAVWQNDPNIASGQRKTAGRLSGIGPEMFDVMGLSVFMGRPITPEDVRERRSVCIIGQNVWDKLFPKNQDPLGKMIIIQNLSFEVIGVLGGTEDPDFLDTVILPISVARSKFSGMQEIRDIYIRAKNWDIVEGLAAQVAAQLRVNQPGYVESMHVRYFKERIEAIQRIVFIFKFFLYSAIVVTLLLGGLGITNVMLAVVKERTTEIGLRKAVGATDSMIISQFLCESLSVSLIGAVVGIVSGAVAVEVLKGVLHTAAAYHVFIFSVVGSVLLAIFLGVVSGVVPARTAGKLDPVEAMRFE